MEKVHGNFPQPNMTCPDALSYPKQQSKTPGYSFQSHVKQRKEANPHNGEAHTRGCLAFFQDKEQN